MFNLVLEVKGMEDNIDRIKTSAARKWVDAVNNWREKDYRVINNLTKIRDVLEQYSGVGV